MSWAFAEPRYAVVEGQRVKMPGHWIVDEDGKGICHVHDEAHANLIAAAPDLLEALAGLESAYTALRKVAGLGETRVPGPQIRL